MREGKSQDRFEVAGDGNQALRANARRQPLVLPGGSLSQAFMGGLGFS
jgi:hypothetical protein